MSFDATNPATAYSGSVGAAQATPNPPISGPGLATLNGLTNANLTIALGTTGPDANIVAAGSTITLHIPDASATSRGFVSTGAQTIAGAKTFSGAGVFSSTLAVTGASTMTGKITATAGIKKGVTVLTPSATVALNMNSGDEFSLVPGEALTINASNLEAGRVIRLKILTSGTSSFVVTFGTGFRSGTATLATGTADAKVFMLEFSCDGTDLFPLSRSAAL